MNIHFNNAQFNQALREYAEASRKDFSEIVDQKALDVALRAASFTRKAEKADIQKLPQEDWWPKYIAKRIAGGISFKVGKRTKDFKGAFTRKQAAEVSKRIINARIRAINFVRSGWFEAAKVLASKLRKGIRVGGKKSYGGATPSRPSNSPVATIYNRTDGILKVDQGALDRAFAFVAKDMRDYIARKLSQTARKHSVR